MRHPATRRSTLPPIALLTAIGLAGCGQSPGVSQDDGKHWVTTWYGSAWDAAAATHDITYRLNFHDAIGGDTVRLRFSNRYGVEPLTLRSVSIALPATALKLASIDAATVRPVTFGGRDEVTIPAGEDVRSDAVPFDLPADHDVAVTFHVPGTVSNITAHTNALTTSWSNGAGGGDATADTNGLSLLNTEAGWSFLTGLEVVAPKEASTVVALGDSITDGAFEIPNNDTRWPDLLNDRIKASDLAGLRSVVNAGISGNMVTADRDGNAKQGQAAITRVAWDAFDQPNVSHIIVYEGINDVGEAVPGEDIVAGLHTIVEAAHERGITVIVATLTPCFGVVTDTAYSLNEGLRYPVNDWIRASGEPDAVVDFDAAVSTGLMPETWQPALTIDFLHPNPVGLMVLADTVPLEVLR